MNYTLSVSENESYVRVKVHSGVSEDLALEFLQAAVTAAKEKNIRNFLFDVREVPCTMGSWAAYEIAYSKLAALGFRWDTKLALLATAEDRTFDFLRTVARNAGYRWTTYTDEQQAIAWLEETPVGRAGDTDRAVSTRTERETA